MPHYEPHRNLTGNIVLSDTPGQIVSAQSGRVSLTIQNIDEVNAIYIGPAAVAAGTGYLILAGREKVLTVAEGASLAWYGICEAGLTAQTRFITISHY